MMYEGYIQDRVLETEHSVSVLECPHIPHAASRTRVKQK